MLRVLAVHAYGLGSPHVKGWLIDSIESEVQSDREQQTVSVLAH